MKLVSRGHKPITDPNQLFLNQFLLSSSQDLNQVHLGRTLQLDQYQQDKHPNVHLQESQENRVIKDYRADTNFKERKVSNKKC